FVFLLFSLMKKVTKKSRHKNASTAQGRGTARFYVRPTRWVSHHRFWQGKNSIRDAGTSIVFVIPRLL
ncbi:hypothetical protein, partial [Chryseosolibacter indicus]